MSRKPIRRIAYVRLSPEGKSYAMRCDRDDFIVGDEVEVLMHAGTDRAYYDDGVITDISHQRWECSCHVVNHIDEVTYSFDSDGFTREIDLSTKKRQSATSWRDHKAPYLRLVSDTAKSDRSGMYEAITPEDEGDA